MISPHALYHQPSRANVEKSNDNQKITLLGNEKVMLYLSQPIQSLFILFAMKKQISTEQTDSNIKEVLRLLAETPIKLESLSKGLSEQQLHKPLGTGERSFKEALVHIVNCEALTADAIYL